MKQNEIKTTKNGDLPSDPAQHVWQVHDCHQTNGFAFFRDDQVKAKMYKLDLLSTGFRLVIADDYVST